MMSNLFNSPLAAFSPALMLGKALSTSSAPAPASAAPDQNSAVLNAANLSATQRAMRSSTNPYQSSGRGTLAQAGFGTPYSGRFG